MTRIGLDLGGTKVFGARVEGTEVVATAKRKTPRGGPPAVIERLEQVVADLGGVDAVEAIGVGAPGPVTPGGIVTAAPNLAGWHQPVALADALTDRLGVAVTVENDVAAATWAEVQTGAAVGASSVLGIWIGTGVGGGLVLDDRLVRGASGGAAEVGHMVVEPGGRECGCGGRGHLEAYVGRAGMAAEAGRRCDEGATSSLFERANGTGRTRLTSKAWVHALEQGDPVAAEVVDQAVEMLAVALASAAALVDVATVVVGGGFAERLWGRWHPTLTARLDDLCFGSAPALVPARLGDPGGALGAALLARRS